MGNEIILDNIWGRRYSTYYLYLVNRIAVVEIWKFDNVNFGDFDSKFLKNSISLSYVPFSERLFSVRGTICHSVHYSIPHAFSRFIP